MTATTGFDRMLTEGLAAIGPQELPAGFVDAALEAAETVDQRQHWIPILDTRAWPARRGTPADPAMRRFVLVAVVLLLAVALVATVLSVGRAYPTPQYRNIFVRTGPIPGRAAQCLAGDDGRRSGPGDRWLARCGEQQRHEEREHPGSGHGGLHPDR